MSTWIIIAVIVVVVLLALAALLWRQRARSQALQRQFGPEYDRTVEQTGDRRQAERDLHARTEHRHQLDIRPLDPQSRDRYSRRWREAQERFVDFPDRAVSDADALVNEVLRERGYPVDDVDERTRSVSVDHGQVMDDYRIAHEINRLNEQGRASTEQLREAMVRYRALFNDLLETTDTGRG